MEKIYVGIVLALALAAGIYIAKDTNPSVVDQYGSASSPSVVSGCMDIEGAKLCTYGTRMTNASTTCSFKLPPTATTSVIAASATITDSYGGSFAVEWGAGTTAYATTTRLGYKPGAIASGDKGTFSATSTMDTGADIEDESHVLAPASYLNFKVGSTSPTIAGYCYAQVMTIQ